MSTTNVRTTLSLPAELLAAVDVAVREGRARSRKELVSRAIRRELAAQERVRIDAAFATMANDPQYQRESLLIAEEFESADWEALRHAEDED